MRYTLRQKIFSLTDKYIVKDKAGNEAYHIDGKLLSIGNQLYFRDMDGNELAYIRQRLLSWGPSYEIYRDGKLFATVKKHLFTLFRCAFTVDVPGPDDYEAQGDFLDMEYTFSRKDNPIAVVSKKFFALSDSYGVEISDGEDAVTILASAVVIDLICHGDHKKE